MASILDGKAVAESIRNEIAQEVQAFRTQPEFNHVWLRFWWVMTQPAKSMCATKNAPVKKRGCEASSFA